MTERSRLLQTQAPTLTTSQAETEMQRQHEAVAHNSTLANDAAPTPFSDRFQHNFSQVPLQGAPLIQAKLTVNAPNDAFEREANRVAEQVMSLTPGTEAPAITPLSGAPQPQRHLQRQAQPEPMGSEEEEVEEEIEPDPREVLQLKATSGAPSPPSVPLETTLARTQGRGQAMPRPTQEFMESRFGVDFSQVRVHTDAIAADLSHSLSALAFTHRNHIYFGAGAFQPQTQSGQRLLAHELTHVIQQSPHLHRKPTSSVTPVVQLKSEAAIQRSEALYFSTHGNQGYFRFARQFHRDRSFPPAVDVSSIEEMTEHMITLPRPITSIRLVTHAVPSGIFLPLLRGGGTSLFQQDLRLESMGSLERELGTEHPTVGAEHEVMVAEHHLVPQEWVRQSWLEINWTRGGVDVLLENIHLLRDSPDPNRHGTLPDLEMHSLFWWILDRELVTAQRDRPDRRGRMRSQHVLTLPAATRQRLLQSINRNIEIFRNRLINTSWGNAASMTRLENMIAQVAPRLIDRAIRTNSLPAISVALPTERYRSIQGAIERGTYPDNHLRAVFLLAGGADFQIRGCNIGQNVSWLESFRDYWGHGTAANPIRPHVSAPKIRQFYGRRRRRVGRRRVTETIEWLQESNGHRIYPGDPQYEANIEHVR